MLGSQKESVIFFQIENDRRHLHPRSPTCHYISDFTEITIYPEPFKTLDQPLLSAKPPTQPSKQRRQQQLQNQRGLMISQGLGGIRTHANDVHLRKKKKPPLWQRGHLTGGLFPGSQI